VIPSFRDSSPLPTCLNAHELRNGELPVRITESKDHGINYVWSKPWNRWMGLPD